jgi:hypothetical protein
MQKEEEEEAAAVAVVLTIFFPTTTQRLVYELLHVCWYSDSLQAGRSGDRIPVGVRFSAPIQSGPRVHPASYTTGTGSFPGVKQSGHVVDYQPPSSAEVKERVELYLYSPSGLSWPVLG